MENNDNLLCPHCNEKLTEWDVPQTPFTMMESEQVYVCFNNDCSYYIRSFDTLTKQGVQGFAYRLLYDPGTKRYQPVPTPAVNPACKDPEEIEEQVELMKQTCEQIGRQFG